MRKNKKSLFLAVVLLPLLFYSFSNPNLRSALKVQIAADVNRDGKVDFVTDNSGKNQWTSTRGAIFFNNNDSDQNTHIPDHADDAINGIEDLKDLSVLKVKKIPDLPQDSRVTLSVDEDSISRVRIFLKVANKSYKSMDLLNDGSINPALLAQRDLELRIEANSYANRNWDGETEVTLSVKSTTGKAISDTVKLKVAPFILLSNLNKGKTLYVRDFPGRNDEFIKSLEELVPKAGAELFIVPAGDPYLPYHIWLQDTMEIGYSEMPGQSMNVVLRANRNKSLDNFAKDTLLGPDFGWIQVGTFREEYAKGRSDNGWLDWYGNLEVTPPLLKYPMGRIYYGYNPKGPKEASLNPKIVAMLEAQKVQAPALHLDTGWLLIKHVDEMISFLPSGNPKHPYKVLVVDTEKMIALLEKWVKEEHGSTRMLDIYKEKTTISTLYNNEELIKHNKFLQRERIEPNIDLLKKELGLSEEDFIRIPSFFDKYGAAIIPNMVNSTILNGHIFIVDPNGPLIDGKDQLKGEMRKLLSELPLELHFLDARQYHKWSGEVHCATNVRRKGYPSHWWELNK